MSSDRRHRLLVSELWDGKANIPEVQAYIGTASKVVDNESGKTHLRDASGLHLWAMDSGQLYEAFKR